MGVRVGYVVAVLMGSAPARPGLVTRVLVMPKGEPVLDVVVVLEARFGVYIPTTFHGLQFQDSLADDATAGWRYGGPELYVRGPVEFKPGKGATPNDA